MKTRNEVDACEADRREVDLYDVQTKARGPMGELPVTPDMLLHRPSGDIFALSQNANVGWMPYSVRPQAWFRRIPAHRHEHNPTS